MESHLAALFHPPSRIFETFKPSILDTLSEEEKGNFAKTPRTGYFLCLFLRTYRVITNNVVVIFMVYG